MAIVYDKTYRAIHLNVDAALLGQLDEYRSTSTPRTQHIHKALAMYLDHLRKTGVKKSVWSVSTDTRR